MANIGITLQRMPDFQLRIDSKGRWYVRQFLGRDGTGKVKQWQHTCRATTEDAAMAEVREEWSRRLGNPTFAVLSEQFIESCKRGKRSRNTLRAYKTRAKYLMPYLGEVRVRNVTSSAVQDIYDDLLEQGAMRGGGLSPNTVIYVHKYLKTFYKWAAAHGFVTDNPMLSVVPPPKEYREAKALDDATLAALWRWLSSALESDGEERVEAMGMYLALRCGLRVSEACAVRRIDVNVRTKEIAIRGQIQTGSGNVRWEEGTKGKRMRAMHLPDDVLATLRAQMQWQDRRFSANAMTPLVSADGRPMRPPSISHAFRREMAKCGEVAKEYRFHNLRHTFATVLLQDGVPLQEVSALLGHADTATTANTYAHVRPGRGAAAVTRLGDILRDIGGA